MSDLKGKKMPFDYQKEYKEFYLPKREPMIVSIPKMNFLAVRGQGDPNEEQGEYKAAIGLLYGIMYTIKMSYKGNHQIDGYFEYVVPPLEGFWYQEGKSSIGYTNKQTFHWISVLRLPDFVTKSVFEWAIQEATNQKKQDYSKVEFLPYEEGLCVQVMHIGSYDDEIVTISKMEAYAKEQGYDIDICKNRLHHEIYLSDPRKCAVSKWKTVIRHPLKVTSSQK